MIIDKTKTPHKTSFNNGDVVRSSDGTLLMVLMTQMGDGKEFILLNLSDSPNRVKNAIKTELNFIADHDLVRAGGIYFKPVEYLGRFRDLYEIREKK